MGYFPPSLDDDAVRITGLTKAFRVGLLARDRRSVLWGLDLAVRRGEVFGYLGPNGSGKTTTVKILMGLLRPDRGSARILGEPLEGLGWRHRTGFLPEHPYLYDYLTAWATGTPVRVSATGGGLNINTTYYAQNNRNADANQYRWDGTMTAPAYPEFHRNPQHLIAVISNRLPGCRG